MRLNSDGFNQLRKSIYDYKDVFVAAWRRDKFPEDVHRYVLEGRRRRE